MSQQDTISVRNWTISIFAGAGIAILLVVLILLFNKLGTIDRQEPKELRYERIKPVGQVNVGEIISITPVVEKVSEPQSGEEVYETVCKACHMVGAAGAPKLGDKAGWTDRIAKGEETLIDHALNGFNTMPARGGNADLSDEEVKRAVQYMLATVGVDSAAEEEATPATPVATEAATPETSTPEEEELATSEPEAEATSSESSSEAAEKQSAAETITPEASTTPGEEESATNDETTSESSSSEDTATAPATPEASAPVDEEPAAGEADVTPSDEGTTTPAPSDDSAALSTESVKVTSSEEASKKKTWAELAAEGVVSSQKVSEIETVEMTPKKKTVSELPAAEERIAAATETTETKTSVPTQKEEKAVAEVTSTEIAAVTHQENQATAADDQKEANETTETAKSRSTTETLGTDPKIKVDEVATSEASSTTTASDEPVVATQAEPATQLDLTPFDLARGEQVYNTICTMCHNTGLVGAPKLGDKESWVPRMAQGLEVLLTHSLKGFKGQTGVMPPKGGQIQVPDEDIKAAVAYMVSKVQ